MLPCLSFFEVSWEAARLADGVNLINLLFLGLCASAACFTTWNMAVHLLGTVRASLYIYLVPVVTVVAAALILDERMTFMSSLGAVLTLAGLFLSQMSRR
jgi:drug/metabolite transporter (DMT)-like permease